MWKPAYASLAEMRDWLRINDPSDITDDTLLKLKLSAASRAVDASCRRQFGKVDTAVTRSYDIRWSRTRNAYVAEIDDLMDLTGLAFTLDGVALTSTQYALRPRNAIADGKPYTWVELSSVTVVTTPTSPNDSTGVLAGLALWGWSPSWPDVIKEASMLQASRLNIRRDSPYGIAGGADGGTLRLLARLDPDIEPLVADYIKVGWVAR
jgi:hypothetical protein